MENTITRNVIKENLKYICKTLVKRIWDIDMYEPIIINGRLTRTLGQVQSTIYGEVKNIQFSEIFMNNIDINDKIKLSVIKHELCHYARIKQKLSYHDHDYGFERELKRIGASSTGVLNTNIGECHVLICAKCGDVVAAKNTKKELNKYINGRRHYFSRCCHADLVYDGTRVLKDTNKLDKPLDENVEIIENELLSDIYNNTNKKLYTDKKIVIKEVKEVTADVFKYDNKMSGKKLWPTLIKAIDNNDKDKVVLLKNMYENIFNQSIKYMCKKRMNWLKINDLVGKN